MAFCMNCGQELPNDAKFCSSCGTATGKSKSETHERRVNYSGELHKCPNCGELLNSFMTNCPLCGYEIRSLNNKSIVTDFAQKLEMTEFCDEKIELITNFYIPNTKEDIYDFFILAVSNFENSNGNMQDAWRAKLVQIYHKAKILFGETEEFKYIEKVYNMELVKASKKKIPNFINKNKVATAFMISSSVGLLMLIVAIVLFITLDDKSIGAILLLLAMFIAGIPTFFIEDLKSKETGKKIRRKKKTSQMNSQYITLDENWEELYSKNYEDTIEQLKAYGFKNIVTKADKKGLFNAEGTIKSISIAGNLEFTEEDEFDVNSKVIIHYYSKKC